MAESKPRKPFVIGEMVRCGPWGVGIVTKSEEVDAADYIPTARYPRVNFNGHEIFMDPNRLTRGHYQWVDDDV